MKKIFHQVSSSLLVVSLTGFCQSQAVDVVHPYSAASYWTEQYVHASGAKSLALVFHTDAGVRYRIESTHDLVNWESVETHYGLGQDIAISMLQTAAAPPPTTPPPVNPPAVVHPKIASLLMRPATTSGIVLQWQSLDDGTLQQHHFETLAMGPAWLQNAYYCEVFDPFYFCLSHPILPAVAVANISHGVTDTAMLAAFENNYGTMAAGVESSLAQQRLNPYVPAPVDPNSKKFFRIVADWSLDSDGDFTPDWVEWLAMQNKQNLQAITTATNPNGSSFQVLADPFSAATNPDGSGTTVPLDSDGDGIVDIVDADLTSKQINWKNISPIRYALFPLHTVPIPAEELVGNKPIQINAQGIILYPRHVWKNDQLTEIPFSTGDLADLAQALSINDAGNILGIGHIGSSLPFYTIAGATTPIEVKGTVAGVTIGGLGSINSGKPGITSTGRFITDGVQQETPSGSNPITGAFLWHINNNQLSYTKITDNHTHYADSGVYWRHAYPKTFVSSGSGGEVELDGQLNYLCETPSADTKFILGDGHAYSQKTGEAWTEIKSIQEAFNYISEFSRVGVGYKTPNSLWMNGKSYLIKNFSPDYDKHPFITDLSNTGHLLFTLSGDGPSKYLAGFPFQLEDNDFATGVDSVSSSTSPFEQAINNGFQDKLWVMAPQGTWTSSSGVAQNNSNAFTIKAALDTSTVTCTCGSAQFNGAATPLTLTGKDNLVEISGTGTATTDDKFSMTMGSTAALSFPIGVKSMKRRTVKVAVHPVVSNAGILYTYTGDPPMPTFFLNKTASGPQIDKVGMTQKVRSILDQIYGKQINVYFDVVISDLKIKDYDTGDTTGSVTPDTFINPTTAEGAAMISDLENPNVDIQVFLLYDLRLNGDIAGYTATMESPKPNCTWIMANPFRPQNADTISRTIAHEIGHVMIGPGHPDDQIDAVFGLPGKGGGKARLKGTDTTKRLMYSHVRTNLTDILLVKAEWDAAEEWLKMVPDDRKRKELGLLTIEQIGNY